MEHTHAQFSTWQYTVLEDCSLLALYVLSKKFLFFFFKELPVSQLGLSQPLDIEPKASPKNRCSFLNDYDKVGYSFCCC